MCVWGARVRVGVCRGWHTVLSGLVFSTHGVQRSCPSAWPVSAHPSPHVHGGQVHQHLDNCIFPVLGKHLNPMTSLGSSSPEKGLVRDDFIQQTPRLADTLHRLPQAPWLWPRGSDVALAPPHAQHARGPWCCFSQWQGGWWGWRGGRPRSGGRGLISGERLPHQPCRGHSQGCWGAGNGAIVFLRSTQAKTKPSLAGWQCCPGSRPISHRG